MLTVNRDSKLGLYLWALQYIRPLTKRIIIATLLSIVVGLLSGVATYSFLPVFSLVFQPISETTTTTPVPSAANDTLSYLATTQQQAVQWSNTILLHVAGAGTTFHRLVRLVIFIIGLTIVTALARFAVDYIFITVQAHGTLHLRQQTFAHLTQLPVRFYNKTKSGLIIAQMENDVGGTISLVSKSIADVVINAALAIIFLGLLFAVNAQLASLVLPFLVIVGLGTAWVGVWVRRNRQKILALQGDIVAIIQEFLAGIRIVKAFSAEEAEQQRWNNSIRDWYKLEILNSLNKFLPVRVSEVIIALVAGALLTVGGWFIMQKSIVVPQLLLFFVLLLRFQQPAMALSRIWIDIQSGLAYAARAFKLLSEPIEPQTGTQHASTFKNQIEFRNIFFNHGEGEVLRNVSFTIQRGQVVALVGPSGSGKSTIADLLLRFYEPTGGKISFDNSPINTIPIREYRRLFGVITQDTFLFHDTIRNNIAYALTDKVSDEQLALAATTAHANEFIQRLPAGYDTIVGERGIRLSGGQRQRIAIARAIVRKPAVLILDEATSALDTKAERMVQDAIDQLVREQTALVIAHRLSTVQKADLILVINEGRIVEQGTHNQLVKREGMYRHLWDLQIQIQ